MSMKFNESNFPFIIEEFCITPDPLPQHIASAILRYHIIPMLPVREDINQGLEPSEHSCYRPYMWEIKQGRSGKSRHTFRDGKGACDWTTSNGRNLIELGKLILKHTRYTRIAYYDTFIHCDYGASDGYRYIYNSDASSNWELIERIKL